VKAIDFPFRFDANGIVLTPSYPYVVRAEIIDAIMTNFGERVMRPRYGSDFQAALFDPSDEMVRRDAASMIKQRLQSMVMRAIIRSVKVEVPDMTNQTVFGPAEPGMVVVTIVYRPNLYATDTVLALPIASEFIARQRALLTGALPAMQIPRPAEEFPNA
jgi:hypothetical protein